MVEITFPDGAKKQFDNSITAYEVAASISENLAREVVACKVNNELRDMTTTITTDSNITFIKATEKEGVDVIRHSTAHILAEAVTKLFPNALPTIGPVIDDGFYYDFDCAPFTPEDMSKIEDEMKKIVSDKKSFEQVKLTKDEAKNLFKNNPYKLELIEEMEGQITAYKQGEFIDLCRGPHIQTTKQAKVFKLQKLAAAYWRGDSDNKQLQRIYGTAFWDKKDLNDHLTRLEEALKRDHRKIIKDLDLVYFHEFAPGAPFFLKKGTQIYNTLIDFIRDEYVKRDYDEVITPQMYNKKLWEISGHWDHYKDNMFVTKVEGQEHSLKPMNCPSHCLIYKRDFKSYKDLPIRIADFCNLHRNELSGTLQGLTRVRKFAQDDGHIFCTMDQIEGEVQGVLDFITYVWNDIFGFNLKYYLSTRPEKALGSKEVWDKAEDLLSNALKNKGIEFEIKEGDGAFYGPKIDIDIEDALGRKWQCPTVQLDFNLPERFELEYEGADGQRHRPVMIHRAILGSLERFFGIMVEHYVGKFPLWLSPVQIRILNVAERHNEYSENLKLQYQEVGLRVEIDNRSETIGKKVREAQLDQINYILVVGDQEVESQTVNVRTRNNEVLGAKDIIQFRDELIEEIKEKR